MKHILITTIAAVVVVGCGNLDRALFTAVHEESIQAVEHAIAAGADVNAKDDSNITPLLWAIDKSHKEIVELLITKGADVNFKDIAGQTPLDWAESGKFTEIADLLRKHGGKNGNNWFGDDKAEKSKPLKNKVPDISIHDAATEGDIEIVKQHLAVGADVELKCVNCGGTVLGHAVSGGHIEIVELLISKSADVNTKFDDNGATPLHLAAGEGHKEIVELLITAGVDVNSKNDQGWSVLDMALTTKNKECIALIKAHGGKSNANQSVFIASGIGDIEAVKQHFTSGADVNVRDDNGWTALHYASDRKIIARFLIGKGAKLNAINNDGETPLDRAIDWEDSETADLLRKHGAKTGAELKAEGK